MTEDELREIEGRLNAATYGPWNRSTYGNQVLTGDSKQTICWLRREFNENHINDADFIAHAREDVCSLLREVRRLQRGQEPPRATMSFEPVCFVGDSGRLFRTLAEARSDQPEQEEGR